MAVLRNALIAGGCVSVSVLLATASLACTLEVPNSWRLRQNNGYVLKLKTLKRTPVYKASVTIQGNGTKGSASGRIGGSGMEFRIYWDNGSVGYYELRYNSDGFLIGESKDYENKVLTGLRSLTDMDCR